MRHATTRLALGAVLALTSAGLGCGGGPDDGPADRISRQDLTDDVGTLTQYWTYTYDTSGRCTTIRTYSGAGALTEVTSFSYANGLRSESTTRAPGGTLLRSTTYTWAGGVLSRATNHASSGDVTGYSTYAFATGRKLTTYRYSATDVSLGRTDFTYDPVTQARTGSTTYDANDVVTGSSTRTYAGGLFVEAEMTFGANVTHRIFTYERGPLDGDFDVFFEF